MSVAGRACAGTRTLLLAQPFLFESGQSLSGLKIAYRTFGKLNRQRDNAILVCHALTGSADVDLWWPGLFGPGLALDPARHFIVASNVLGGCYGSSGPMSLLLEEQRACAANFPALSVRDMVRAQVLLLDHLCIEQLAFALGGSMGGMQVLEWIIGFERRVRAAAVIAAPASHSAWAIALSRAQCEAVRADPKFLGGNYTQEQRPLAGLGAARRIGMCSYRSPASLDSRFGRRLGQSTHEVSEWLDRHAQSFAARFDANTFLSLSAAMDAHDLGRGRGSLERVLRACQVPTLAIGIASDVLYPASEVQDWAAQMPAARFERWDSIHGHDAFLIEAQALSARIADFWRSREPQLKLR